MRPRSYSVAMARDLLADFDRIVHTHDGQTKSVYRQGTGPAIVVMAEIPGITPDVADFARILVETGYSVWMPSLFGTDGAAPTAGALASVVAKACVSKEFGAWATNRTAPVTTWLRSLAARAHDECGGPGVGAIGMCFTGGFALGMMVDDVVVAPALSQPSLPLGLSTRRKASLHLSPDDQARVIERAEAGVCVLGMRFSHDPLSPPERFETLRRLLGDSFIGIEIDSSPGNALGFGRMAHSVVTEELVRDDPSHPTAMALARLMDFFAERLLTTQ